MIYQFHYQGPEYARPMFEVMTDPAGVVHVRARVAYLLPEDLRKIAKQLERLDGVPPGRKPRRRSR